MAALDSEPVSIQILMDYANLSPWKMGSGIECFEIVAGHCTLLVVTEYSLTTK